MTVPAGRLLVVGTGAELPDAGLSDAAVKLIDEADRVLYLTADPKATRSILSRRPDAESLLPVFEGATNLRDACLAVAEEALSWVRLGQAVAAVFVGISVGEAAHVTAANAAAQQVPVAMLPAAPLAGWLDSL